MNDDKAKKGKRGRKLGSVVKRSNKSPFSKNAKFTLPIGQTKIHFGAEGDKIAVRPMDEEERKAHMLPDQTVRPKATLSHMPHLLHGFPFNPVWMTFASDPRVNYDDEHDAREEATTGGRVHDDDTMMHVDLTVVDNDNSSSIVNSQCPHCFHVRASPIRLLGNRVVPTRPMLEAFIKTRTHMTCHAVQSTCNKFVFQAMGIGTQPKSETNRDWWHIIDLVNYAKQFLVFVLLPKPPPPSNNPSSHWNTCPHGDESYDGILRWPSASPDADIVPSAAADDTAFDYTNYSIQQSMDKCVYVMNVSWLLSFEPVVFDAPDSDAEPVVLAGMTSCTPRQKYRISHNDELVREAKECSLPLTTLHEREQLRSLKCNTSALLAYRVRQFVFPKRNNEGVDLNDKKTFVPFRIRGLNSVLLTLPSPTRADEEHAAAADRLSLLMRMLDFIKTLCPSLPKWLIDTPFQVVFAASTPPNESLMLEELARYGVDTKGVTFKSSINEAPINRRKRDTKPSESTAPTMPSDVKRERDQDAPSSTNSKPRALEGDNVHGADDVDTHVPLRDPSLSPPSEPAPVAKVEEEVHAAGAWMTSAVGKSVQYAWSSDWIEQPANPNPTLYDDNALLPSAHTLFSESSLQDIADLDHLRGHDANTHDIQMRHSTVAMMSEEPISAPLRPILPNQSLEGYFKHDVDGPDVDDNEDVSWGFSTSSSSPAAGNTATSSTIASPLLSPTDITHSHDEKPRLEDDNPTAAHRRRDDKKKSTRRASVSSAKSKARHRSDAAAAAATGDTFYASRFDVMRIWLMIEFYKNNYPLYAPPNSPIVSMEQGMLAVRAIGVYIDDYNTVVDQLVKPLLRRCKHFLETVHDSKDSDVIALHNHRTGKREYWPMPWSDRTPNPTVATELFAASMVSAPAVHYLIDYFSHRHKQEHTQHGASFTQQGGYFTPSWTAKHKSYHKVAPLSGVQHEQLLDAFYWAYLAAEPRPEYASIVQFYKNAGVIVKLKNPYNRSGVHKGRCSASGSTRRYAPHRLHAYAQDSLYTVQVSESDDTYAPSVTTSATPGDSEETTTPLTRASRSAHQHPSTLVKARQRNPRKTKSKYTGILRQSNQTAFAYAHGGVGQTDMSLFTRPASQQVFIMKSVHHKNKSVDEVVDIPHASSSEKANRATRSQDVDHVSELDDVYETVLGVPSTRKRRRVAVSGAEQHAASSSPQLDFGAVSPPSPKRFATTLVHSPPQLSTPRSLLSSPTLTTTPTSPQKVAPSRVLEWHETHGGVHASKPERTDHQQHPPPSAISYPFFTDNQDNT